MTNPTAISASATVAENEILVTASGGTGDLTYSIDGVNFQASNVFENLQNGDYTITVQDANGCMTTTNATVLVNNMSGAATVSAEILCFGEATGAVTATVTGGAEPYQYSINGGATYQTGSEFTGLAAGAYSVTILDNDGLTFTTEAVVIGQPTELLGTSMTDVSTITLSAEGGVAPYLFNIDGGAFAEQNVFTNLPNGVYEFGIQDANGCTTFVTGIVAVDAIIAAVGSVSEVSCFDGNDGVITVTTEGGTAPYLYSLDGENFQESNVFENLSAGTYTVTVQDATGLTTQTETVVLENPTLLSATTTVDENSLEIDAAGGTAPYTYSIDGVNFQTENVFMNLANGDYLVSIADVNGCLIQTEVTIAFSDLNATVTFSEFTECHGDSTGIISVSVTGGSLPYSYSIDGENFQGFGQFINLPAGTYHPTVTDGEGFTFATEPVIIGEPEILILSGSTDANSIEAVAEGGTAPYFYSIDGENFQDSGLFANLEEGEYTVTVQDANGCTQTAEVMIIIDDLEVVEGNLAFVIYPNPTAGGFTVEIENELRGGLLIEIYNVVGQLLYAEEAVKSGEILQHRVSDLALPAGTYTVRAAQADLAGMRKVVILR